MIPGVKSITRKYVEELIDFAPTEEIKRAGIAPLQMDGSVALFNMLVRNGIAYLADEVGMGKTYIGLAVMSLLRYQKPDARVLIITPRRNIQEKWASDLQSFVQQNWRRADHRVKTPQGSPDWPVLLPDRLSDWVRQLHTEDSHDTILRSTSFSLGINRDNVEEEIRRFKSNLDGVSTTLIDQLDRVVELPTQAQFIDVVRKMITPAAYDLVIVDEAHNLKHGYRPGSNSSIRNESLYQLFAEGRAQGLGSPWLLMLSATPLENGDPSTLVRQFEVFGRKDDQLHFAGDGSPIAVHQLADNVPLTQLRELQRRLIVRRVGELQLQDKIRYTRNRYRKEWRAGGVEQPDMPMPKASSSARLINAVLQKNVFELLQARAGGRFRIGALESFEIYAGAASALTEVDEGAAEHQQALPDQQLIAELCESYRKQFAREVPHPKLDAVTRMLGEHIARREKALVFVRRVATTNDLASRASEYFDRQIIDSVKRVLRRDELPLLENIAQTWQQIRVSRDYVKRNIDDEEDALQREHDIADEEEDDSVSDVVPSFFTWFFRGEHRALSEFPDIVSGRRMREQLEARVRFSLILEENYVDWVLLRPTDVVAQLAEDSGLEETEVLAGISNLLADDDRKSDNFRRMFHGVQYAALSWMAGKNCYKHLQERLLILLDEILDRRPTMLIPPAERDLELVRSALSLRGLYPTLARCPEGSLASEVVARGVFERINKDEGFDFRKALRRREQIRHMQMALFRHGAPVIDLYLACIASREGRISQQGREIGLDAAAVAKMLATHWCRIGENSVARQASGARELSEVKHHFDLIKKLNFPTLDAVLQETRPLDKPLTPGQEPRTDQPQSVRSVRRLLNQEMAGQSPTVGAKGGQSDERRHRITTHFRMPGMPWVVVATNVYEEGVDLHTFCRTVVHHGVSHTASSVEQRTGRVDRIGGLVQREASELSSHQFTDEMKIQSLFPYQNDTFEKYQVRRVLANCNRFLQALHDSDAPFAEAREMNISDKQTIPPQIEDQLTSPFDVEGSPWLSGDCITPDGKSDFSESEYLEEMEKFESLLRELFPEYTDPGGQGLERHYYIRGKELRLVPKSHRTGDHLIMELHLDGELWDSLDCNTPSTGWADAVIATIKKAFEKQMSPDQLQDT